MSKKGPKLSSGNGMEYFVLIGLKWECQPMTSDANGLKILRNMGIVWSPTQIHTNILM